MKKIIKLVILAGVVAFLLTLSIFQASGAGTIKYVVEKPVEVEKKDILTRPQRAWLGALIWCESRGNVDALNKKDRDGTPSYGLLQFKPSTFTHYAKLYGIDGKAGYKDADTQEKIVEQMIIRGGINWSQQFPTCTKKLGTPPKLSTPKIAKKQ
jgi:hypothetical protein